MKWFLQGHQLWREVCTRSEITWDTQFWVLGGKSKIWDRKKAGLSNNKVVTSSCKGSAEICSGNEVFFSLCPAAALIFSDKFSSWWFSTLISGKAWTKSINRYSIAAWKVQSPWNMWVLLVSWECCPLVCCYIASPAAECFDGGLVALKVGSFYKFCENRSLSRETQPECLCWAGYSSLWLLEAMAITSQSAETKSSTGCSLLGSWKGQRRGTDGKELAPGWKLPSAPRTGRLKRHWKLLGNTWSFISAVKLQSQHA